MTRSQAAESRARIAGRAPRWTDEHESREAPPGRDLAMSLADGSARRAGLVGTLGVGALVTAAPLEGIPTTMLLEALGAWVPWHGAAQAGGAVALGAIGAAVALLYGVVFERASAGITRAEPNRPGRGRLRKRGRASPDRARNWRGPRDGTSLRGAPVRGAAASAWPRRLGGGGCQEGSAQPSPLTPRAAPRG